MIQIKKIVFCFVSIFCSFLFLSFAFASNENLGITMSEEDCQVSCYDAEEDATYKVAMSATAWINTNKVNSCGLVVYEHTYKNDVPLIDSSTPIYSINTFDEVRNYGGYLYGMEKRDPETETYAHGFNSAFLAQLQQPDLWWKLLFTGYVDVEKSINEKITATYIHRINPCPVGTYVEIHAMCDAYGWDTNEVGIGCTVYKNDQPWGLENYKTWRGTDIEYSEYNGCLKKYCEEVTVTSFS